MSVSTFHVMCMTNSSDILTARSHSDYVQPLLRTCISYFLPYTDFTKVVCRIIIVFLQLVGVIVLVFIVWFVWKVRLYNDN